MHDIRDRLAEEAAPGVTVLPDGSIDRRFEVVGPEGRPLSRAALSEEILADVKTILTRPLGDEPGGQAVNAARQLHALGAETTLVGHLDDPIFGSLPVSRYSMGAPAEILLFELDDGVLMFAAESEDILSWTVERLRTAVGPPVADLLSADAVLWTNWAAFPHATEGLSAIGEMVEAGTVLVVDPGAVSTRPEADRVSFLEALGAAQQTFDVVVSPNRREADHLAAAIDEPTDSRRHLAAVLRERAEIEAVVVHDVPSATVATADDVFDVPTVEEAIPSRHAGGGDRFSAGVTFGLAAGWEWAETVTLANACATHYLVTGDSGTPADLATLVGEG